MSIAVPVGDDVSTIVAGLQRDVARFQEVDLSALGGEDLLGLTRDLEVVRRRLDAATVRVVDELDRTGAYGVDGDRTAKASLVRLGRLPGAEAHGRVAVARALRRLPAVAAAFEAGRVPMGHVRAIARVAANPRVTQYLEIADAIFAEQASCEPYDEFVGWLRQWESLADADGAAQAAARTHERRTGSMVENAGDGSTELSGRFGALQGAAMREIFERFVDAELEADWADARARLGDAATPADLARTPAQRNADALFAIFRRAAASPADGKPPVPLVNIVIDQTTFDDELRRAIAGGRPGPSSAELQDLLADADLGGRRCHTDDGTPLTPGDAVAAAVTGQVRRVVIDADSTVIDLGRRRRLFTGSARDAALVQAVIAHGGLRCARPGCNSRAGFLQVDHIDPAARGGPTNTPNSQLLCPTHNQLKEHGWRPARAPDGTWQILPPDGTPTTPPA